MIKHFKFWLMVIGVLFFVACGSSDSSSSSASSLIEGKTFYYEVDYSGYKTVSFNNGTSVHKVFYSTGDITGDVTVDYVESDTYTDTYTLSGDRITSDGQEAIVSSTSNGIKMSNPNDVLQAKYYYNTLADAQNANQ